MTSIRCARNCGSSNPSIKGEFDLLKRHLPAIPAYHEVDRQQERIAKSSVEGSNWRVFFFEAMGRRIRVNRDLCPDTAALIDRIPRVFQACFSILEPRKSVPAHCGLYEGYLRYHLGIEVPQTAPPSIRIKNQDYTWREGEGVLFDDTWPHEIKNECPEIRAVLIVDIPRPMTGVAPWSAVSRCCSGASPTPASSPIEPEPTAAPSPRANSRAER